MINILGYILASLVFVVPMVIYLLRMRKMQARANAAAEQGEVLSGGPRAQHPQIDLSKCIGCGSCVRACPEGDVLAVVAGKASIVNANKCIGHGLCAEACPVEAIRLANVAPSMRADLPFLTPEYETNIRNMFIAGELGGLALIKNAVNQGRDCIDTITKRLATESLDRSEDIYDVCIVGAGPAGISASLRAIENGLCYIALEQNEIGGTVAKYPRQKLVMTSPVEFPLYGKFKKMSLSKEEILDFWHKVGKRADFGVRTCEGVEEIERDGDGIFNIKTLKEKYCARSVILALGRTGTPRKLGIKGEELPKVMYHLIETESYRKKNILVVGGGDSAVEAAMGLASQKGNVVTLSYRKDSFSRIKQRNARCIGEFANSRKIHVLFNSNPVEIKEKTAILEHNGKLLEIPNDYVWIFAGGVAPNAFLTKIGVQFGAQYLAKPANK
jgi:thioredoxin reductase (NADPH)